MRQYLRKGPASECCWIHAKSPMRGSRQIILETRIGLFRTTGIIAPTFGGALSRYWNPFEMWQYFTGGVL